MNATTTQQTATLAPAARSWAGFTTGAARSLPTFHLVNAALAPECTARGSRVTELRSYPGTGGQCATCARLAKTTTAAEATELADRKHAAYPVSGTQTVRSEHTKTAGVHGVTNLRRTDGTWPGYDGALPWSVLSGPYGGPFQLETFATAEEAVARFNALVAPVCASCGAQVESLSASEECAACHRENVARGGDEPCPCALCTEGEDLDVDVCTECGAQYRIAEGCAECRASKAIDAAALASRA